MAGIPGPDRRVPSLRLATVGAGLLLVLAGTSSRAEEERALDEVRERASMFGAIPVELREVGDDVWVATGVSNSYLVQTSDGAVVIDTGLPHQARAKLALLEGAMTGQLRYLVLTHSHVDHTGGTRLWLSRHPEARVIAHEEFPSMQRTLEELAPYYARRGRLMMPGLLAAGEAARQADPLLASGGIEPDVLVDDDEPLRLELGGTAIEVLPLPGGEGADGLGVWLPGQRILFTGDLTGPHFPMWPNFYTVRGERYREFLDFVSSVERTLALSPRVVAHGHFDVIRGEDYIRMALSRQRDAVQYVHDQTVAGMNAGRSLPELMREIQLPPELRLSEGYGKVSWSVRGLWETYTGWFDFASTTGLYPVPVREVYPDLVAAAQGPEPLLAAARRHLAEGAPVRALHLLEIAETAIPGSPELLALELEALGVLRERAVAGSNNFFEVSWLEARIAEVREQLQ